MENKQKKNNIKIIAICGIFALIMLVISIFAVAYSRYVTTASGNATANIAKIICEMEVVESSNTETVINPYCIVTVKNYRSTDVSETDIRYTIEVVPKDNIVLPEFYWTNASGTIIAHSQDVLDQGGNVTARTASFPFQYFSAGVSADQVFKIVFLNSGEQEITRLVDFNLKAVQSAE